MSMDDKNNSDEHTVLSGCEAELQAEKAKLNGIKRKVDEYKRAVSVNAESDGSHETLDEMRKKPTKVGVMFAEIGNLVQVDFSKVERFIATEISPFEVAAQINYTGSYNMTLGKRLKPSSESNWALPIGVIAMVMFIVLVIIMTMRGMF